jgi:DNA helicase-2/ATP-dependent DNA helicase PcrA
LRITYSHVFLDEFQDTTTLQYEFMKACFYGSDSVLTAVGDDKQRIMEWAGADREIFKKFKRDFHAKEYILTVNHRSSPRLIKLQQLLAGQITGNEAVEVTASNKWDESEGICEVWNYENPDDEAEDLSNNIEQWIEEEGLKPKDISVLVRQRPERYTEDLINTLKSKGILARNESQLQDLLAEDCVRVVLNYLFAMLTKKARQEWIDLVDLLKYFRGILSTDDSSDIQVRRVERELSEHMQAMKRSIEQVTDKAGL